MSSRREKDRSPNADERVTMNNFRFEWITEEDAIAILGSERFHELLTPRERRARKAAKP